jgi:hypothetical protein
VFLGSSSSSSVLVGGHQGAGCGLVGAVLVAGFWCDFCPCRCGWRCTPAGHAPCTGSSSPTCRSCSVASRTVGPRRDILLLPQCFPGEPLDRFCWCPTNPLEVRKSPPPPSDSRSSFDTLYTSNDGGAFLLSIRKPAAASFSRQSLHSGMSLSNLRAPTPWE